MSADEHYTVDRRETVGDLLEHPLVGLERRRTKFAVGYLLALAALFVFSSAGPAVAVDGVALESRSPLFDHASTVLIAVVAATITIGPFCYAAWNGGPALALAIPLVPVFLGDVAAGRYVLGLDAAIALTAGGAASALALYASDVRRTRSLRPWRTDLDVEHLLFVTSAAVVAAVSVGRYLATAPPRSLEWYAPFAVCWLVPLAVVGAYWGATVRATVATRARRERSEP